MMQVWITGARGFIGRHAAAAATGGGATVIGLGHGHWPQAEYRAAGLADWYNGEIAHANLDALAARHGQPDVLLHLAGGSAVGPSFAVPQDDFTRTVTAAAQLLEWVRRRAPQARLVLASSAAVYGAGHMGAIVESAPCAPFSPYGFHKRMAELAVESYARNFGLAAAIVRFFSVYGPGLQKQLLWDACTRLTGNPQSLDLGGHGTERRDWLHVSDAVQLMLNAAQAACSDCPVFNGGTGVATSIAQVANTLCEAWQLSGLPIRFSGVSRAGDPASLVADVSSAHQIGWAAHVSWERGAREYVDWFRAQATGARP